MKIPTWLYNIINCSLFIGLVYCTFYPKDTITETDVYSTSYTSFGIDATADVQRELTIHRSYFGLNINVTKIDDVTVTMTCRKDSTIIQTYIADSAKTYDTTYQRAYSCVAGDNVTITHNNQKSDGNLMFISDEYVDRWNPSRKGPSDFDAAP